MYDTFFVSDLHGNIDKYKKLFNELLKEKPDVLFLGGDLLPSGITHFSSSSEIHGHFINGFFINELENLRKELKNDYPDIFLILGNDDAKLDEKYIIDASKKGYFNYIHGKKAQYKGFNIFGYSYIPPTPFQLKDWEKYDVSRYTDIGCISPEKGIRTVQVDPLKIKFSSIQKDLEELVKDTDLSHSIFLFHSPPYKTNLDRAALDGKTIDHAPLDVHVGSIAIKKFIEEKQPYLTMHGHIHESARILDWKDKIGDTFCFNASHDNHELSIIKFNFENPENAVRVLL